MLSNTFYNDGRLHNGEKYFDAIWAAGVMNLHGGNNPEVRAALALKDADAFKAWIALMQSLPQHNSAEPS